jgi:TetR/AcrR family transcriptional regulator, transcriptional repressor for nem operon
LLLDGGRHIYAATTCRTRELAVRVSRAQAEENRRNVIDVASRLFRARGFDGIGLNDLMKGAGLTQGGFYKQFESKEDLAVQATARALEGSMARWADVIARTARAPLRALVRMYLSEPHRDAVAEGCPLAALGPEVARRSPELRQAVEAGIKTQLAGLDALVTPAPGESARDKSLATLSTMVGALILSRAVADPRLSKRFLHAAAHSLLRDSPERTLS